MGYQALLFCPDEKTARTITPILTELEFEVVPCSEPFAAVKKLMDSHFDAVVVDCDNEQNASLLFKSAHSSPQNQAALAVAVVEGQAGVAKAFRIGANLVLTKPINVEQSKGTLRVARGLLRKTETAKMKAAAAPFAFEPSIPGPAKVSTPKPGAQVPANASNLKAQAAIAAAMPIPARPEFTPAPVASITASPDALPAKPQPPSPQSTALPAIAATDSSASTSAAASSGSGAAPAVAKEIEKPAAAPLQAPPVSKSKPLPKSKIQDEEEMFAEAPSDSAEAQGLPVPAFALTQTQPTSPAGKKMLIALAAIVLIVIAGYAAWTQLGLSLPHSLLEKLGISGPSAPLSSTAPVSGPILAISSGTTSAAAAAPVTNDNRRSNINGSKINESKISESNINESKPSAGGDFPANASVNAPFPSSHPGKSDAAENSPASAYSAEAYAATPIVIKNSPDHTSDHAAAKLTDSVTVPAITQLAEASVVALPNVLNAPATAPQPQLDSVKVSQGVSRGLLIKQVDPTYPAEAMRAHLEGDVQVLATISKSGKISAVRTLSGNPQLAHAAVDAVKQWKYKPYLLNSEPVEMQTEVTVRFKLPR